MYDIIEEIRGNVVAIRITGEISDKENEKLSHLVEQKRIAWGRIRVLIAAVHYPSFNSAEDLYDDLGFLVRFSSDIERMAVVGDRSWKTTWVALFGLFSGIEARYFAKEDFEEAWRWLTAV